jgi:hypothetical protein
MTHRAQIVTALGIALLTAAGGCSSSASSAGADQLREPTASSEGVANRAIAEADIIELDGDKLYTLSASGAVSVVDVATPSHLALLGQTRLAGEPFEMYRRGDLLFTMWNGSFGPTGTPIAPLPTPDGSRYVAPPPRDPNAGAAVVVLDVRDPARIRTVATFPVPGELADSRIVGDVLYLATYENAKCYRCATTSRTVVTSFDLSNPLSLRQVDQAEFRSTAPESYNLAWGSNWKRSLFVTGSRLYVGGHGDIDPLRYNSGTFKEGIIDVLDVSDPTGRLVRGARIEVAGAILSRWQMEERDGVLRVVSQRGAGRTANGVGMPEVDTFSVVSTQSYTPLGHTILKLPRQEGLRTVRFDKDRAYAITYNQGDPLFTIDLRNPALPTVRGELIMPGFMYYLEPYGDRLIGLGVDRGDPSGSLNVSLFDVSNLDHPTMLSRVPFATPRIGEDFAILNYEVPEDQDRIQKAFRVFPDGLVAVPFTGASRAYYRGDTCQSLTSGVQLVDWQGDTLKKAAFLPMRGNPRRALQKNGELLAVSDSNVRSFALGNHAVAMQTADLVIGECVPKTLPGQDAQSLDELYPDEGYNCGFGFGCNVAPAIPTPLRAVWPLSLLMLSAFLRRTRGRNR